MVTIGADMAITAGAAAPDSAGTGLRGYLTTDYETLLGCLGAPDVHPPIGERGLGWVVGTPVGAATVYDHTVDFDPREWPWDELRWSIGGHDDAVLPWIYQAVLGSTEAFPTGIREFFADSTLATLTAGYADYLHLRMWGTHAWLRGLDHSSPVRASNLYLPAQFNHAANAVRGAVLGYQWATSADAERRAWVAADRPHSNPRQQRLQRWHAVGRWLHAPLPGQRWPRGNADLAGALRAHADTLAVHRPLLAQVNPQLNLDLHREHENTLRALAQVAVPGLDAVTPP